MKTIIILLTLMLAATFAPAQESNKGKQMWAKSVLNQQAPEFTVQQWLTPQPEMKGKFVLIDFWATWCGPCRKAIPELNTLQKEFKKDLVVIGISDETPEKVLAMTSPVIEYFSAIDTKATMKNLLEVKGIPHVILIDPKGIVRWEGFPSLPGNELTPEVVKTLIGKYK